MVLLAAAVCTKAGKPLVSRHFVEMTRPHVEGLLSSFSKLIQTDTQHTFVETESVRYVYQPLEKLYMLLITTKQSNILEDLETLRLFSRVIPEYCTVIEEREVSENAFNLIFAFDEIVALGYRENVNLNQIKTFTEMDSQEEKVYLVVRQNQEKEAKEVMKRRAKELEQQRRDQKSGRSSGFSLAGAAQGFGSTSAGMSSGSSNSSSVSGGGAGASSSAISAGSGLGAPARSSAPVASRGMKLGSKKPLEAIVAELGGQASHFNAPRQAAAQSKSAPARSSIHIKVDERINMTAGHDSGMESLEVKGVVYLNINSADDAKCRIAVRNEESRPVQFQTHPNVDKKLFGTDNMIALKQAGKAFPVNSDVPVLKWRFSSNDESHLPLSINCWPSDSGDGNCSVNIEYELLEERLELHDVLISIPCPTGVGAPTVSSCDGDYKFESRHGVMEWRLPVIETNSSKQGSMEFSMPAREQDFFPVTVSFTSETTFCNLGVASVLSCDDDRLIAFSHESHLIVDNYIIN